MEEHQESKSIKVIVAFAAIILLILGCFVFFTHEAEGDREQRAGEVYIIGDEIVHRGYIGSGEGL